MKLYSHLCLTYPILISLASSCYSVPPRSTVVSRTVPQAYGAILNREYQSKFLLGHVTIESGAYLESRTDQFCSISPKYHGGGVASDIVCFQDSDKDGKFDNIRVPQLRWGMWKALQQPLPYELTAKRITPPNPNRILVTTGSVSQPHRILGEVKYSTVGSINFESSLKDALFRSPLSVAAAGATPKLSRNNMNIRLRQQALQQYGNNVDAIINTTYETLPDGDAFGSGIAVQFVESPSSGPPSARPVADRLKELDQLRDDGMISSEEYEQKRKQILESL